MTNQRTDKNKEYYSPKELAEAPWFPLNSESTIRTYIETGKLPAVNVGVGNKIPRWKIPKEEVVKYLLECGIQVVEKK